MIQQNFEESDESLPCPLYAMPGPRVLLEEGLFGRNLMAENTHVPLLSHVTVSLAQGNLRVIQNDDGYYARFPSTDCVFDSSPHHAHRKALIDTSSGRSGSEENLLLVDFVGLRIEFAHKHYLAGNGVEVDASQFIVLAPGTAGNSDLPPLYSDRQTLDAARVLFAPKTCSLLNFKDSDFLESTQFPHIRYSQQGCLNFRRCRVDVRDSYVSLNLDLITRASHFFLDPVQFLNERYSLVLSKDKATPDHYEFKASMDVEVSIIDTLICAPVRSSLQGEVVSMNADVGYSHCWRGFLESGPGKVSQSFTVNLRKMFIADISDVNSQSTESLVMPFEVQANIQLIISPSSEAGRSSLVMLRKHMCVPNWTVDRVIVEDGNKYYRILFDLTSKESSIGVRLAIEDILFLIKTGAALVEDLKRIQSPPSYFAMAGVMLNNFSEIQHLRPVTEYAVYLRNAAVESPAKKIDIGGSVSPIQLVLVNNTYNLRIARLDVALTDFCYVFHRDSTRSLAGGATISLWSFNDRLVIWEPFVEPFNVTCVSTTEVSVGENDHPYTKEKVEMNSGSLDVVVSQYMLTSFIKKMSLNDVHMSLSHQPSPYRVTNKLGVPVFCCVQVGQATTVLNETIAHNDSRDIESYHFGSLAASSLSIAFILSERKYKSRNSMEMDTEGVFPFTLSAPEGDDEVHTPIVFLDHSVKPDGSRELMIRSLLLLKNCTTLICEVSLKREQHNESVTLKPGAEWMAPLALSFRETSLYMRIGESSWTRALHSLDMMVTRGKWGSPHQLRSQLCECTQFGLKASSNTVMIKPVVFSSGFSSGLVPVRAPTLESVRELASNASQGKAADPFLEFRSTKLLPLTLAILPTVTLYNQLCQPFLYRFSSAEGFIFAEGALNPCETVNLHVMPRLFEEKYYVR